VKQLKKFKVILLISGKQSFYKLLIFLSFSSLLELGGIGLFYPYLDFLLNPQEIFKSGIFNPIYKYLNFSSTNSFLFWFGIVAIILVITSSTVGAYSRILIDRYIWRANILLIRLSFKRYIEKSYVELKKLNSNNITNNIITEVSVFINGLMVPLFDAIPRIFILLLSSILLFFIDFKVALSIFSGTFLIYFGVFRYFRKRLSVMSEKRFEMQQALFDYVNSSIRAVKDIKVNNSQDFFIKRVEKPATSYSRLNQAISIFSLMPRYFLEAMVFSTAMLVLLINQSTNSVNEIIPILSLYAIAAFRLIPHIQGLFTAFAKIKFNIKALSIISSHLNEIESHEIHRTYINKFESIETSNVSFGFSDSDKFLFHGVDFKVSVNQFVIIVGKSGTGKSTFIEILLGLIEPAEGQLILNGKPLTGNQVLSGCLSIGYVSQDVILFEGTLKENIMLYKNKDMDESWLMKIAEIACLEDVIKSIGGTMEGKIYEGGKNLSVGQRQRVSIARSIFNNPELLFLDEATSALDSKTELNVILNIKDMGTTVILITHNTNLITHSDATYELKNSTLKLKVI
jgi:ABC-type bacteriocin/lantibiotic exporter with double-glycine peptidase domain